MVAERDLLEFEPACRGIARHYFAPGLEQDDLLQEARLGAWEALRDFRGGMSSLPTFVRLCAERKVITAVKAARRHKHSPLNDAVTTATNADGEHIDALDVVADSRRSVAESMDARDEFGDLAAVIALRLTDLEREALLGFAAGLSYETLAERLRLHPKGIDNAIQRARRKIIDDRRLAAA